MLQQKLAGKPELTEQQEERVILVVDDEPMICQLCARALSGFRIIQACDGKDALKVLDREAVDIILSDIMMPNLNGLELLNRIKERQPDQAVVLMTGFTEKEVILQALKAGADDFINKPLNLLQLRTTVEKVLDKIRMRKELLSLRQVDKLKSAFLGLISHKLKTPTTSISLFIQNLDQGIDLEDEDFRQTLSMVAAETRHLEHLIQDLLYFSNVILQDNALHPEPLELGRIACQVALILEPEAKSRRIDFQIDIQPPLPPEPLILDRQRITFALRALIDNAIKFTPEGGSVQVEGRLLDDRVRLTIRDTGVGIEQAELAKVFNKFYQIDPEHTGQIRGFGLGLFYAREFVRAMGGELILESSPGLGTEAIIEFPLPG